ncbi:hypothetical protein B0O99DRAFT_639215 [Bisporella sp. PMI_857]|nr:hypothetical protein B0O99DRAFT_639215 [Bisporella sp. PMI_857]
MEHNKIVEHREEAGEGLVLLERMPQQAEVRVTEDDWTGRTDAAERRKRQNRLHQRLYRKRQKLIRMQMASSSLVTQDANTALPAWDPHLSAFLDITNSEMPLELPGDAITPSQLLDPLHRQRLSTFGLTPSQVQDLVRQAEQFVSRQYMISSPRLDLLLTLVQFNVFRALLSNTIALGFTLEWMNEDAISPFLQENSPVYNRCCPPSLRSTALQRHVSHHPWIDLFPFPSLRDNMLLKGEDYDDNDLCHDLVEMCHAPAERSGLIVWSNPWDPMSWEATTEFIHKWPWILRGCPELLVSTNYWRGKRGEEEVYFDVTPSELVHI